MPDDKDTKEPKDDTQPADGADPQEEPGADGGQPPDDGETPQTYEAWLATQPAAVKKLIDDNTAGLKSALTAERTGRKDAERQVRDLAAKAEKGSEAQAELEKVADQMAEADRKADFYEAAHAAGVTNIRLAYTVATQDGMFDKCGDANFEAMKQEYPELFGGTPKPPVANAGAGTRKPPTGGKSMNDYIRKASGR